MTNRDWQQKYERSTISIIGIKKQTKQRWHLAGRIRVAEHDITYV